MSTPARDAAQAAADKMLGAKLFRVEVVGSPSIDVPADDDRQAVARYFEICGVRGSAHPVGCECISSSDQPAGGD